MSDKWLGSVQPSIGRRAKTHRSDIDGLRAVAILGVIAYHFGLGVPGGYGGVDVFFVISGFLIAGIIRSELEAGTFSLANFYVRRIRRILPAFAVCALITTGFAAMILLPRDFKNYGASLGAAAISTSNFYFKRQAADYFAEESHDSPLLHTWSLSVEEQFYLFFPLFLVLLFNRRRAIVPVMAIVAVTTLLLSTRAVTFAPKEAFFSTLGRAWELLIGGLLAIGALSELKSHALREAEAALGAAMIAFAFFANSSTTPFPGLAALPLCLGAALIIHSGEQATSPTVIGRALSWRPAVWLGLISYSVYLWHWPLVVLARYRFPQTFGPEAASAFHAGLFLLLVSIGLGFLSWRFVEEPFRHAKAGSPPRPVFVAGAVAIAALSVIAFTIKSWPNAYQHWPEDVVAAANVKSPLPMDAVSRLVPAEQRWPSGTYEIGDANAPGDTVLWGDSHAIALVPGLAAYVQKTHRHVLLAPHPSCAPLIGVTHRGNQFTAPCRALNAETFNRALGADIKRVVLEARWARFAGNTWLVGSGEVVSDRDRDGADGKAFAAALEATVESLVQQGKEVIILGSVPEQSTEITPAMLRSRLWDEPLPKPVSLDAFLKRQGQVTSAFAALSAIPNVRVLYPHKILCDAVTCHYARNGKPLYSDDDHLTPEGAAELEPLFAEIFVAGCRAP